MGFNYGLEKKRFDEKWKKTAAWYAAEGMSQDEIDDLYKYDWECFCQQRAFENHTQPIPPEIINEDAKSELFRKYKSLSVEFSEEDFKDRYAWIQTIDDYRLAKPLKRLSKEDKELLTLIVIHEFTQEQIAERFGISQRGISKRIQSIRKKFQ